MCVCVYIYTESSVSRAVSLSLSFSLSLSLSLSPPVYLPFVCIYLYPSCIEIARALNPGSGHEIVIPERLTLLPHLAGAPRSSLKVRKVRGRTERQRRMKDARTQAPTPDRGKVSAIGSVPGFDFLLSIPLATRPTFYQKRN